MAPDYLTVVEILAIHDALVDEFGGAGEIRDIGALEAAVFRPQTGYYEDPIAEAAALMESLIGTHPFVDGNKRTVFAAADLHLRINGWYFEADSQVTADFIISGLEQGRLDRIRIESFLREHSTPP